MKKTILYILNILIKIGNVWERNFIDHKKYENNNILHLENIYNVVQVLSFFFVLFWYIKHCN